MDLEEGRKKAWNKRTSKPKQSDPSKTEHLTRDSLQFYELSDSGMKKCTPWMKE